MTVKKKIKSRFLLALRKAGMLCKQPFKTTRYINVYSFFYSRYKLDEELIIFW